jgi:hypothetical protein
MRLQAEEQRTVFKTLARRRKAETIELAESTNGTGL